MAYPSMVTHPRTDQAWPSILVDRDQRITTKPDYPAAGVPVVVFICVHHVSLC